MLMQHNLNHEMKVIKAEKATDMKHMTHHATIWSFRNGQLSGRLDQHIVSECAQRQQHALRVKALLCALGQTQSLLVAFQGRFDAAATLVVKRHIGRQNRYGIGSLRTSNVQRGRHLLGRQRANQHARPAKVPSCFRHSTAMRLPWANIVGRGFDDPAKRALGPVRVLDPPGDCLGQAENPLPRILFRHDEIAPSKQPIADIQSPRTGIHADHRPCPFRLVQFQGRLSHLHQRRPRFEQCPVAHKEAINNHFLALGGRHAAQLPPRRWYCEAPLPLLD